MQIRKGEQNSGWKNAPFLRLLLPLIIGIGIEKYFPLQSVFLIPVFCLSVLLIVMCNTLSCQGFFEMDWIAGMAIQLAIFSFGRMVMHFHQDIPVEQSSCFSKKPANCLLLRLLSDPVPKQNSWKVVARVSWLCKNQCCYFENEQILVYFNKKLDARQVSSGSLILFRKELQPIRNEKTTDFDYKGFCRLRHIYGQVFLNKDEFVQVGHEQEKTIISSLDSFRRKLLIILKKQIPRESENGFLEALLFGYTVDLDPGLLKSYADTGVIHIIAISGLHLALICQLLQMAIQTLGRRKSGQWLKFIVVVTCLWAYSLFSGASPSAIRAAAMFSLVLFARNILREAVLFNTLAASAFILLCFDPAWLWDTGFQLSYAAVLGLRLFAIPLQALIPVQNKILKVIWKAASVSIAAQVLTTPVSIFYFHRFPVYFLVANLVAVPLSSGILLGGIGLCICYRIQPVADFLGWMLGAWIQVLNGIIRYISKLPGSVISQLTLTIPQLIVMYIIIFCFHRFLSRKQKPWFLAGLSAIVLFQFIRLIG